MRIVIFSYKRYKEIVFSRLARISRYPRHKRIFISESDSAAGCFFYFVATFGQDKKVPIMDLRKRNDPDLAELADYVYQNIFLYYTMKQWGKTPDQIDPAVMGRVPIFVGDDDRYFPQAQHQGMPIEDRKSVV